MPKFEGKTAGKGTWKEEVMKQA